MKKVTSYFVLVSLIFLIFPYITKAKTLNDYKNELKALQNKAATNAQAQENKKIEINDTNNKISDTQNQIQKAQDDIYKAQQDIAELNVKIKEKEEETKELIRFNQISSGENSYLEFLFGAKDMSDFIYRTSVVEQLSAHNKKVQKEMQDLIEQNKKKHEDLKELQVKLNDLTKKLKAELGKQISSLASIADDAIDIKDQISEIQGTIKTYEKLGCKPNQDISSCVDVPVGTGFSRPTKHGVITSSFGYRNTGIPGASRYHPAVDIGVSTGTPVYASAPGKVMYTGYNSLMGYYIRIDHNINGSKYNTVYQHLNSINCSTGQTVSKASLIAYSGSSGIGSGPHLHFGISRGSFSDYSSFVAKAVNPASLIYFPSGGWSTRAY